MKDLVIEPLEIEGRGDLAYARGRYSLVLMIPNAPEQRDSGKYLEIWRKQADGSWKLSRDTFNSDVPLPAPRRPRHRQANSQRVRQRDPFHDSSN